jgi:hypothetical protein
VTTAQRIQIRRLFQKAGLNVKQGDELTVSAKFIEKLQTLAERAGGEAPKPATPDTTALEQIRLASGNEQLLLIYNLRDDLTCAIDDWTALAEAIEKRWPAWNIVNRLMKHAEGLQDIEVVLAQIKHVKQQRQLLETPDLIAPIIANLTQLLREELNRLDKQYSDLHKKGMERLHGDLNWNQLEPEQRYQLMSAHNLHEAARPKVEVQSTDDVLNTLDRIPLSGFGDRVAAIQTRFDNVIKDAATLLEPQAQFIEVPKRTLKTVKELDEWIEDVKHQLTTAIEKGPIVIT